MNPLISSLIGNKLFLAYLKQGDYNNYLGDYLEVLDIIPPSKIISKKNSSRLTKYKKDNWLIKKGESSRAENIFFGENFSPKEWKEKILKNNDGLWIIQKKINPDKKSFCFYENGNFVYRELYVDFLPFLIKGEIVGIFNRISPKVITNFLSDENKITTTFTL